MAKRFTETSKWGDPWFRALPPKMKTFWEYIRDNCDAAGVWVTDWKLASFCIGAAVTAEEARKFLGSRVHFFGTDKLWIVKFIAFQYGRLSEDCKPHRPILASLRKHGLFDAFSKGIETLTEPLAKGTETLQDKDKEKEKDQGIGGLGEKGTEEPEPDPDFVRRVVAYLNQKTGKAYRPSTEATAAAIRARRAEGYAFEDFRIVIDNKCADWLKDPRWEKYLCPETLFRPGNFEKYRNQINSGGSNGTDRQHSSFRGSQAERNARAAEENYGPLLHPAGEHD